MAEIRYVYPLTCKIGFVSYSFYVKNPVEAVSNWSTKLKLAFCSFSIALILIQWIWAGTWFYDIYYAHATLNKLPYMLTRYLQLSHRFFTIQAISVTFYYVFQYVVVIYLISINDSAGKLWPKVIP